MTYEWVILDTETTGLTPPIYVVEVAAQRMVGTEPDGEPFSCLINHDIEIPDAASRIHGYTRDILERDGLSPKEAHKALREFVGDRFVVAYNLPYDWDDVLVEEWRRLGIEQVGRRGFCALRLVRRLLDPVPAGNCKLQTLRRYYDLPERAAHSAKGDVLTVLDLFEKVLFPVALKMGMEGIGRIAEFAEEEWYPSKIGFGKHKGKDFRDPELNSYLQWLSNSENPKFAAIGQWYLDNLHLSPEPSHVLHFESTDSERQGNEDSSGNGIVVWSDPDLEKLKPLVERARERLADAETEFGVLKSKIDKTRSIIFKTLRPLYESIDNLKLKIKYRRTFLDALLRQGDEGADGFEEQFREAEEKSREQYQKTEASLSGKKELSEEEEGRLKKTWRKLVQIFHPDRHQNDREKREKYQELTAMITRAKEEGDLETLEEIAADPEAYASKKGLGSLDLSEVDEAESLKRLWNALQAEIIAVMEAIEALKRSSEYELAKLAEKNDDFLDEVIEQQKTGLQEEEDRLNKEADKLNEEIEGLTGETFLF